MKLTLLDQIRDLVCLLNSLKKSYITFEFFFFFFNRYINKAFTQRIAL